MPDYFTLTEVLSIPQSNTYGTDPIILDVDGDGLLDVVVAYVSSDSTSPVPVRFFRGDGLGGFTEFGSVLFPDGPPMAVGPGTAQLIADFNSDGRLDIFLNDWGYDAPPFPGSNNLLLLTEPVPGIFDASNRVSSETADHTYYASHADIDGDGDIDIFVGNAFAQDAPYFLINDGFGNFTRTSAGIPVDAIGGMFEPDGILNSLDFIGSQSAFVDVNSDGILDLLILSGASSQPSFLLIGDGAGSFTQASLTLPSPQNQNSYAEAILSGDFNSDGRTDLIISYQLEYYTSGVTIIFINDGNGQFYEQTASRMIGGTLQSSFTYELQWIDLNGDNILDILAVGGSERGHVYLGDGSGNFIFFPLDIFTGTGAQAADVNADGRLDFIIPFSTGSLDDLLTQGLRVFLGIDAGLTQVGDASDNGLMGDRDNEDISGLDGNDVLFGGDGSDRLDGGTGADYLNGGVGADTLIGGAGNDTLNGAAGNDTMHGGSGADQLTGGSGNDTFRGTSSELSGDTIIDLAVGETIVITDATLASFSHSLSGSTLTYTGGSLTFGSALTGTLVASAASGGGVQLTLQLPPKAKLILTEAGQDFTIGGDIAVTGTTAPGEIVEILHGEVTLDASFNVGGDTVVLPGNAGTYTAVLAGSFVTIAADDLSVAIPVGTAGLNVQFADSTRTLRFDSGSGQVLLGTQAVTSTEATVAASGAPLTDPVEVGPDSLGRLILSQTGQDIDIGGNVTIVGTTSGGEVMTILGGTIILDASFNVGGDTVVLPGAAADYTATLSGSFVTIAGGDISIAIPVGVNGLDVHFSDATETLRFDTTTAQVMLGDQVVSSSSSMAAALAQPADKDAGSMHSLSLDDLDVAGAMRLAPSEDWLRETDFEQLIEVQRFEFSETFSFG